jgi:hemoglobin
MKADIEGLNDIKSLVNGFYSKVQEDKLLAPIFMSKISHWEAHLDIMYRFWNAALFNVREYQGNPFMKHMHLPLQQEHFERWINLFYASVDEMFTGPVADEAKRRAMIMAHTFYRRMNVERVLHPLPPI